MKHVLQLAFRKKILQTSSEIFKLIEILAVQVSVRLDCMPWGLKNNIYLADSSPDTQEQEKHSKSFSLLWQLWGLSPQRHILCNYWEPRRENNSFTKVRCFVFLSCESSLDIHVSFWACHILPHCHLKTNFFWCPEFWKQTLVSLPGLWLGLRAYWSFLDHKRRCKLLF